MNIVPFQPEHFTRIQAQDAQRYLGQFFRPEIAATLASPNAFSALDGDIVLAAAGVAELYPGRGLSWAYLDRRAGARFLAIHRAVARFLAIAPFRRIEAEVDVEFEAGHRWVRALGFELEAPRMRCHRIDGGDSALYARIK